MYNWLFKNELPCAIDFIQGLDCLCTIDSYSGTGLPFSGGYWTHFPRNSRSTQDIGVEALRHCGTSTRYYQNRGALSSHRCKNGSLAWVAISTHTIKDCFLPDLALSSWHPKSLLTQFTTYMEISPLTIGLWIFWFSNRFMDICCWKCNFPMTLHVRLLLGWSVCHNVQKGRELKLPFNPLFVGRPSIIS